MVLTPAIGARMHTEMQRDGTSREDAEAAYLGVHQWSHRFVTGDNVGGLPMFLCGPHSADINGAALPVDAGWIAGR